MDCDPGTDNIKPTKLKQEGYGNKFVEALVDDLDFVCAFCTMVVREAQQISTCGHIFCRSCWEDWVSSHLPGADILCPVDNDVVNPTQVFHDRKQDRVILGLRVFCDNEGRGCGVTPELRYLQAHVDKCEYSRVTCELSCGQVMYLRDVEHHMTEDCPLRVITHICGMLVQAKELQNHDEICLMKNVTCEFCQATGVLRDLPHHHKTDCASYPTFCNFALFGCKQKVKRSSLKQHHDTQTVEHMHLMNSALYKLYEQSGLATSSPENDPHELPYELWGQVCGAVGESGATVSWDEMARCGDEMANIRKRSVFERVEHLEQSVADVDTKYKESKETMKTENRKRSAVTAEMKNDIEKLTAVNDELVQKMAKMTEESAKMKEVNVGLKKDICDNENKMDEKMRAMEEKNRKFQRGEIVEDAHYRFPCHWFVELKRDMEDIESPQFYIGDGYKMSIFAQWIPTRVQCVVGATFVVGENDDNLTWPWSGDDVMVVTDVGTGQVYQSEVYGADGPGRLRPPANADADDKNNPYFWNGCLIKCDKKPIKVKVVIRKKMRLMEEIHRKFQRGEIVEDAHYRFPCHWFVELKRDMKHMDSPQLYVGDGYKMYIFAGWDPDRVGWVVGAAFVVGENDDNLTWPWAGDDVMVVTDVGTGQVYESDVGGADDPGRLRPPGNADPDDKSHPYFWNWCDIKCDKTPTKVKVVIRKKTPLMEEKIRKFQRGEIVEDAHYRFPCHWFVELKRDMVSIESPRFYVGDGYKMFILAVWIPTRVECFVGAAFVVGENDDNLTWPWAGDDVMVVTDVGTGQVYESRVVGADHPGRLRPPANVNDEGTSYPWTACLIKCDKKPIKVKVVIRKGK